jgi:hypothetical protein
VGSRVSGHAGRCWRYLFGRMRQQAYVACFFCIVDLVKIIFGNCLSSACQFQSSLFCRTNLAWLHILPYIPMLHVSALRQVSKMAKVLETMGVRTRSWIQRNTKGCMHTGLREHSIDLRREGQMQRCLKGTFWVRHDVQLTCSNRKSFWKVQGVLVMSMISVC